LIFAAVVLITYVSGYIAIVIVAMIDDIVNSIKKIFANGND
jgi:Flp pilus assembly pilin Flp